MGTSAHWILLLAAFLHVVEEYSTGFLAWFRRAIPTLARAMTWRWALLINTGFLGLCLASALWEEPPTSLRLVVPSLLVINALLHIAMTVKTREWSPGLATAVLLYLPLGVWVIVSSAARLDAGAAWQAVVAGAALGVVVHAVAPMSLRIMCMTSHKE